MTDSGTPRGWSGTVLVIADDPCIHECVRAVFGAPRTVAFGRGRGALRCAAQHPIDVAIIDRSLCRGAGSTAAAALHALAARDIALVGLSPVREPGWDTVRHLDAWVRKPFVLLLAGPDPCPVLRPSLRRGPRRATAGHR
jgi:DNA-binding NarL/FixJ family response regulator